MDKKSLESAYKYAEAAGLPLGIAQEWHAKGSSFVYVKYALAWEDPEICK